MIRVVDRQGELRWEQGQGELVVEEAEELLVFTDAEEVLFASEVIVRLRPGCFSFWTGHRVGSGVLQVGGISVRVQVQPRGEKLSAELWGQLLADLERWMPGILLGREPVRVGTVGEVGVPAYFLAEALFPLVPELIRGVAELIRNPLKAGYIQEEQVAVSHVRHLDAQAAIRLGRPPPPSALPQQLGRDHLNHPANRMVAFRLVRVIRRLFGVASELVGEGSRVEGERLVRATEELNRVFQASFLAHLPHEPVVTEVLDPGYRRVLRLCERLLSPRFSLREGGFPARVRPSYHLYELWCLLAVLQMSGEEWVFDGVDALFMGGEGEFVARARTCPELEVWFNPVFPGWSERGASMRWSTTSERRPDIVVRGPGGWVALDAKYRAGKESISSALGAAHMYRDALRWNDARCRASVILVPAALREDWFDPVFIERFGVGAFQVRPMTRSRLQSWLGIIRSESLGE